MQAAVSATESAGLVVRALADDGAWRWSVIDIDQPTGLAHLDLHSPHDLRHTYATWLEEAGIPARMIDELMGHRAGSRPGQEGSTIGRVLSIVRFL